MADLSITAANVLKGANAVVYYGTAGAAITAGQVVYKDAATGTYKLADSNVAGATTPAGIALHAAATGQPLAVQTAGDITLGAVLTAGAAYYLSETAGGIEPAADLGSGETIALLGLAKSISVLALKITMPGVTI
jgi:hypothetical protein